MYQVQINIPYEGIYIETYNTLDEIVTRFKKSGYSFSDIEIYEIAREIDIYQLMAENYMKGG